MRFGDIYTNGINHWMVVYVPSPDEPCNNPAHSYFSQRHELRPVVLDKDGNPSHFVGFYTGQVSDIKPYAKLVKRLDFYEP